MKKSLIGWSLWLMAVACLVLLLSGADAGPGASAPNRPTRARSGYLPE